MSLFDENPNEIYNNIKELLIIGAKNRNHTFHTPVFSTINKNSKVNSRIVVLRKFDQEKMILRFNTDSRSPKILELKDIAKNDKYKVEDFLKILRKDISCIVTIKNNNKIIQGFSSLEGSPEAINYVLRM